MSTRAFAAIAAMGMSAPALAGILYAQPAELALNAGAGFASDAVSGQFYDQLVADNFLVDTDSTVHGIDWVGMAEVFGSSPMDLSNVASFTVALHSSPGVPGDLEPPMTEIYSETFAVGATAPNLLQIGNNNSRIFSHSVDFASPVAIDAGTVYWVSIGATLIDPQDTAWEWHVAPNNFNDGYIAARQWSGAPGFVLINFQNNFGDMAFTVRGEVVPPAASVLPLLGLLASRRRR